MLTLNKTEILEAEMVIVSMEPDRIAVNGPPGRAPVAAGLAWPQAFAAGPEICGGKGYNLGRLHRYGYRIPRGGVIPAAWYSEMLAAAPGDALAVVQDASAGRALEPEIAAALGQIRNAFESAEFSPAFQAGLAAFLEQQQIPDARVAVRSSATSEDGARASFAGIHSSFLNARGLDEILRAIRRCYASLWTPQALAYRRKMNFADGEVLCAVVICEMVHAGGALEPHSAGVAFSFDPVSGRRDLIVIDAAPGSGEAVVGGTVEPQRIVFRNSKGRLQRHSHSGGAALLPPGRERELAHQVFRLHWDFGDGQDPQDVEWAYDGKDLWFLQVRPATRVQRFLPALVAGLPRHWSTANIKDAVPGVVCALTWSLLQDAVESIAFAGPISSGYQLETGAELVRRFRGRGYFELTLMQWVMYDALGITPEQLVQSIGGHQPEIAVPSGRNPGRERLRRMMAGLRLLRKIWGIEEELSGVINKRAAEVRRGRAMNLAWLTPASLMAVFEGLALDSDSFDLAVGLANTAEGPWEMALEALLKPKFGDQARPLMGRLLAGTGSVTSAEHGYAIFQLAAAARNDRAALEWLASHGPATEWTSLPRSSPFRAELESFLDRFGHRAVYEADYLNPRWAEDPTYILDQVRFVLANPQTGAPRDAAQRIREEAESLVRRAAGWRRPIVFWLAKRLRQAMAARESAKSAMAALALVSKRVALELGRRLAEAGHVDRAEDVFHLTAADLLCWMEGWWDGAGARELASERARQREAWLAEEAPPDVITEEPDGRVRAAEAPSGHEGEIWRGIGAAPGRARGAARIIHHPSQAHTFRAGEVLVAPSTDPGWTPLFLRASAIVMASGGYLSHGAIVAREYGIPAVVNLPGILSAIREGDLLLVDGDSGRVVRESGPAGGRS
jgi:rifampicin phosphotransferase